MRPIGSAGQQRILDILPGDAGEPPVIAVVRDATDNTVLGISAADGKTVWSCPGPIPRDPSDGVYHMPSHIALLDSGREAPPKVYYAYNSISRVRHAASNAPPQLTLTHVSTPDRRWQRDLPWARHQISWGRESVFIGWSLAFSAFLVVLPLGYVGFLVWKRRFTLATLLWLPVVAGLFLMFALMKPPIPDSDFVSLLARLSISLFLAPAVLGIALVAWWSIRGRWRPIVAWSLVSVLVSGIMMTTILATDYPLLPEQTYDWSYWYVIWFPGAFLTSWLMLVIVPLMHIIPGVWRWWRKPKTMGNLAVPGR
jgi:hypothetical protein